MSTSISSPKLPVRTPFAAGDYITRYPEGDLFALRIDCNFQKPDWQPRISPESGKPPFPGTAIKFEERYYEIILMAWESVSDSRRCSYYLRPWEENFPIRVQFHYTPAECFRLVHAAKRQAQLVRQTALIKILAPLAGMLPETDQRNIQNRYGIQATHLTTASAILLLFPGGYALILFLVSLFEPMTGSGSSSRYTIYYLIGSYFFVESLLRLLSAMKLEEPLGSLLLYLPVEFCRAVRRALDPSYRSRGAGTHLPDATLSTARDEVTEVSGQQHDLEIVSLLPKPHWNPLTGVNYQGLWYGPIETQTIRDAKSVRYRFLLKKAPEGTVFRATCVYTPEEIRDLYREKRRRDLSTWVDTFAPFWGLLNESDQKRLEQTYDFDALKFSRWTILALGSMSFFSLLASIVNVAAGVGSAVDLVLFFPSCYLLLESFFRWRNWKQGHPSGSILRIFVRPLASRLLE